MGIWYDEDTLLEQVLDTMPEDIQFLFPDPPYVTEDDIDFVAEIEEADELALHNAAEEENWRETQRAILREERAMR